MQKVYEVLTGTLRSRAAENTGDQADSNDELQKLPIGLCPVEVEHIFSTIFGSISCKVWLSAEILVKGHPIYIVHQSTFKNGKKPHEWKN